MSKLPHAIEQLRALNQPVPRPMSLPSEAEVAAAELDSGVVFPPEFRQFLLEASDVVVGTLQPVTLGPRKGHTDFASVLESARAAEVPEPLIPICEDNGSYFCVEPSGRVVYWDHNGSSNESWPSVADWILDLWIGEM